MRNKDLLYLASQGILNITSYTLTADNAYRVFKFRKALNTAIESIQESERRLWSEADIEDGRLFDIEIEKLRAEGPSKELELAEEKLSRYRKLRESLYEEDAQLEAGGNTAIPYGEWRKLQEENKAIEFNGRSINVLSGYAEILLENVLWKAPEE